MTAVELYQAEKRKRLGKKPVLLREHQVLPRRTAYLKDARRFYRKVMNNPRLAAQIWSERARHFT